MPAQNLSDSHSSLTEKHKLHIQILNLIFKELKGYQTRGRGTELQVEVTLCRAWWHQVYDMLLLLLSRVSFVQLCVTP